MIGLPNPPKKTPTVQPPKTLRQRRHSQWGIRLFFAADLAVVVFLEWWSSIPFLLTMFLVMEAIYWWQISKEES